MVIGNGSGIGIGSGSGIGIGSIIVRGGNFLYDEKFILFCLNILILFGRGVFDCGVGVENEVFWGVFDWGVLFWVDDIGLEDDWLCFCFLLVFFDDLLL